MKSVEYFLQEIKDILAEAEKAPREERALLLREADALLRCAYKEVARLFLELQSELLDLESRIDRLDYEAEVVP